jgi:chromosomal replication initiator protein
MEELWNKVLDSVNKRVSQSTFGAWVSQIKFLGHQDDSIFLGVPSRFARDWINDNGLKDIIQQEFSTMLSREIKIVLRVTSEISSAAEPAALPEVSQSDVIGRAIKECGLNPRYRFEDFVSGPSNQLAYAAAISVAENPASNYNPLFIYGGAGLGKTHLLNAIGYRIIEKNPSTRVLFVSTESFTNEFINCIRSENTEKFRQKYRASCDVLLLDDVQFLSNRARTQEEFFHTFNYLYEAHRQIVLTSDSTPQEIPELEERLRTRFQWGLIADIQVPEVETRIAILQKKAEQEGLDIPDDVAFFIASKVKSNIREIEGSLKRLRALSEVNGEAITVDFARRALEEVFGNSRQLSLDDVIKAVAIHFNIRIADLRGNRRLRTFSRPRQIAMYLCRSYLGATFPSIASHFNKDHSTVISSVKNIEQSIKTDQSIREAVEALKRQLGIQ